MQEKKQNQMNPEYLENVLIALFGLMYSQNI